MPAARDVFSETITWVDTASGSVLKPLSGVQVTVYLAGTTTLATIFAARSPNSSTQVANPFTTNTSGLVEFWATPGEYDIAVHDLNTPTRVADKTIGFNSTPAAAGGIPSALIAADGGLPYAALDAVSGRQFVPIGTVIDWWRPVNTVPVPTGYAVADGSAVAAANHDFGTGTSINLPDLRNAFVLGASTASADGAQATNMSVNAAGSPGIGGKGGTHTISLSHTHDFTHTHTLTHTHTTKVPSHYHSKGTLSVAGGSHGHSVTDPGHSHVTGLATLGNGTAGSNPWIQRQYNGGTWNDQAHGNQEAVLNGPATTGILIQSNNHTHPSTEFSGSAGNTNGVNGDVDQAITTDSQSTATTSAASNATTTAALTTAFDSKPQYVGLLKLIKIKRN